MTTRVLIRIFLTVALVLLLAGCGAPQSSTETEESVEELSAGEEIFQLKCRSCHKMDGIGGNKGPNLSRISAERDADFFDKWLRDPKSVRKSAKMPKPRLTDEERANVIEFLESRK